MESAEVGVGEVDGAVEVEEEEEAEGAGAGEVGGEPDVVVDFGLLHGEAGALADASDESGGDLEGLGEVALGADNFGVLLVDPDGAGEVAEDFFGAVAGFGVRVAGVIRGDGVAAGDLDAAGVGEGAELEHAGDGDFVVAARVGLFALAVVFGAAVFYFADFLVDAVVFLFEVVDGEGCAVLADELADGDAVDPEDVVRLGLLFFGAAVAVGLGDGLDLAIDVVAQAGFVGALVGLDLVHEGGDVRKRAVGRRCLPEGEGGKQG